MRLLFKDQTAAALADQWAGTGVTPNQIRRVCAAVARRNRLPEPAPGLPRAVIARLAAAMRLPNLTRVDKRVSPADGFARYAFRGDDDGVFEAVRIPLLHRAGDEKYVVCVSCQVGCALGCRFCATGRIGFRRDLATWEMVDQVLHIAADSPHPVRGVVFMGMGEPMLNLDAVLRAADILSEPCGGAIAGKAITLSTVGIVAGLRRFIAARRPYRLIVSLVSADPATRRALLPAATANPLDELREALRDYHAATRRRVTLAWPLLAGINTRDEDARQLAAWVGDLPVTLDLIDVNDPTGAFKPPAPAALAAFRDALRRHLRMPVARRYSGGHDIRAGCGMLAGDAAAADARYAPVQAGKA